MSLSQALIEESSARGVAPSKDMDVKNDALFHGRRDTSSTRCRLGSSSATTLMLRGTELG